eukprot:scaffold6050_cov85-Skeletonema_marinoi.AAC.1
MFCSMIPAAKKLSNFNTDELLLNRNHKMRCVPCLLLFQSTTWPCLFGDLSTVIAFALLDAAIVMSDGDHHVADDVEPNSKRNTVFCSDRCVSFNAPLISDQGSRA